MGQRRPAVADPPDAIRARRCSPEFASMLGVGESVEVLCVERARIEQTTIISYDYRYVHPNFAYGITRAEAASNVPLLESLRRSTRLLRGENRIEAAIADAATARLLGTRRTEAVLIRETCYFGEDGMPVICGRSYYRADKVRCSFSVDMSANTASRSSWGPVDPTASAGAAEPARTARSGVRKPPAVAGRARKGSRA